MPLTSTNAAQSIVRPGVCTSATRPASPFDGQVIYMTDVDQTAVWDGSAWVGIERSRDRNVVINGAMQVAQRGTSTAAISATYNTADRWGLQKTNGGTWTQSVENDAPTGSGFGKSLKWLVTTAAASPAAGDTLICQQNFEGQNLQQFLKGTASAKQFTLSFWVKSNVTGTYVARMVDVDNSRHVCATYSISASATWEKKTITFPADTTGAFDNDNAESLRLQWGLVAGSNFTSGTLATTWATNASANAFVGQTNVAATLNNYWQITGVQLEAGAVATPFEFEDAQVTLAKCQRYYWRAGGDHVYQRYGMGIGSSSTVAYASVFFPVSMRAAPSSVESNLLLTFDGGSGASITSIAINAAGKNGCDVQLGAASGFVQWRPFFLHANNSLSSYLAFNAEL